MQNAGLLPRVVRYAVKQRAITHHQQKNQSAYPDGRTGAEGTRNGLPMVKHGQEAGACGDNRKTRAT